MLQREIVHASPRHVLALLPPKQTLPHGKWTFYIILVNKSILAIPNSQCHDFFLSNVLHNVIYHTIHCVSIFLTLTLTHFPGLIVAHLNLI